VRALINVKKPLKRGLLMRMAQNKSIGVYLKYERLDNVCYLYGGLNNIIRDCEERDEET